MVAIQRGYFRVMNSVLVAEAEAVAGDMMVRVGQNDD